MQGDLVPAKAEKPVAPAVQKLITHVEEAELLRKRFLQTAKGAAPFDLLQDVVAWEGSASEDLNLGLTNGSTSTDGLKQSLTMTLWLIPVFQS